jgi:hypothetical protein
MSAARSFKDAGISGRAVVMASAKSRANRRTGVGGRWYQAGNRSQDSVEVLRCMRMRMQRSARVSGRCPMAAMILGTRRKGGEGGRGSGIARGGAVADADDVGGLAGVTGVENARIPRCPEEGVGFIDEQGGLNLLD